MAKIRVDLILSLTLFVGAVLMFLQPFQFLKRFAVAPDPPRDGMFSLYGFAASCLVLALALAFRKRQNAVRWLLVSLGCFFIFVLQTYSFSG